MTAAVSSSRRQGWLRGILAGPVSLVVACLAMAGGSLWLPPGRAQVNNLVLPVVLFPLLWTVLFLYALLDKRLKRAYLVVGLIFTVNVLMLAWHFLH